MSDILTSMRNGELPPHLINQLRPEIMGVHALNPGVAYNSPSRNTMMSSHISQHLVTEKMDIPLTIAGPEVEYSKSTVSSRVPCDATVFDTIERYPRGVTGNSLSFNPETLVVYCDEETGSYGFVTIPYHTSLHQYFGFKNVKTDAASRLTPGTPLARDTVLADTPANIGRFYTATTNANVALMAEAGTAEDGVVACEESLENFAYHVFERRSASVGQKKFPIRIGGEGKYYKCFPDIGEEVPESGELLYLREYVEGLSPVLMSERATREVDYTFDDIVHARQGLKGRVVDIRVTGNADTISALPVQMTEQFEKYRQALIRYYKAILETERRMIRDSARRFGTTYPKITSAFTRLLIEARAMTNHDAKRHGKNLQLVENRNVLDQYRIEFVVEYRVVPDIGSKLTSLNGDKGVITSKLPRSRMPRDADGNVADFVKAPDGTVARTNYGRGYLMYLGGAARELRRILEKITNLDDKCSPDDVEYLPDDVFNEAWGTIIRYHRCINDEFTDRLDALPEKKKRLHLYECLEYGVINVRPVDTKKPLPFAIMDLEENFPQTFGPVTHAMIEEGRYDTTIDKVRIAPLPIKILDKTTDDTLVAATASHGAFGVLVKHNQSDRYSKPWKDSPPRGQGEAENRVYGTHTTDPRMAAEMVDRSTNPAVQLHMVRQFVNSEHPSAIEDIVDRQQFPYGTTKPLELQNNFFQSYGVRFKYVPEDMRDILESDLREIGN